MKKLRSHNLITVVILLPLILLSQLFETMPWWSFVLPVFIVGMLLTWLKWKFKSFICGFIAGFLIWFGFSLFFQSAYSGVLFGKYGTGPAFIFLLITGIVGGLVTGLSLYTGKMLVYENKMWLTIN